MAAQHIITIEHHVGPHHHIDGQLVGTLTTTVTGSHQDVAGAFADLAARMPRPMRALLAQALEETDQP